MHLITKPIRYIYIYICETIPYGKIIIDVEKGSTRPMLKRQTKTPKFSKSKIENAYV